MDEQRLEDEEEKENENDEILNRSFNVRIEIRARRKGEPIGIIQATTPDELKLVEWYLRTRREVSQSTDTDDVDFPPELLETATRVGLLIKPSEEAPTVPPFSCNLDETLLPLIPAHAREPAFSMGTELVRNERIVVQHSVEPEPDLLRRIDVDPRVSRLFSTEQPADNRSSLSNERPIVWIANPYTNVFEPYWCGGTAGKELLRLALERPDVANLSRDAIPYLRLANALVPLNPRERTNDDTCLSRTDEWRYAVIRGLVSPLWQAAMRRHFRLLRTGGWFTNDAQQVIGFRDGAYCDAVSMFLQYLFRPVVASSVRHQIKPSFTWVFRYRPGAVLQRHTDRPQCRWNVSVCVDLEGNQSERPWPIFLDVDGSAKRVDLSLGDALVYSGTDVAHWREQLLEDQFVTVCLFHYVDDEFSGKLD